MGYFRNDFLVTMSHFTTTKPYWCLTNMPGASGFTYSCDEVGTELECNEAYVLNEFDTEDELATFVDGIKGIPGWYYECNNRIPYPPNLVEWDYEECVYNSALPPEE